MIKGIDNIFHFVTDIKFVNKLLRKIYSLGKKGITVVTRRNDQDQTYEHKLEAIAGNWSFSEANQVSDIIENGFHTTYFSDPFIGKTLLEVRAVYRL